MSSTEFRNNPRGSAGARSVWAHVFQVASALASGMDVGRFVYTPILRSKHPRMDRWRRMGAGRSGRRAFGGGVGVTGSALEVPGSAAGGAARASSRDRAACHGQRRRRGSGGGIPVRRDLHGCGYHHARGRDASAVSPPAPPPRSDSGSGDAEGMKISRIPPSKPLPTSTILIYLSIVAAGSWAIRDNGPQERPTPTSSRHQIRPLLTGKPAIAVLDTVPDSEGRFHR